MPEFLRNPVIIAIIATVLMMMLTAGSRMSSTVWIILAGAMFFGSWKATELLQVASKPRYR